MGDITADQWERADEAMRKSLPSGVKLVRTLRGHTGAIGSIAWSPDGRMLASPSADMTIRLWDVETGECLRALKKHHRIVDIVTFDPTGQILVSGSEDNTIKVWDPNTGKLLRTLKSQNTECLAFYPVDCTLAIRDCGYGNINLWQPTSGILLPYWTLELPRSGIFAFDPKGRLLACVSNGFLKLFKAPTFNLIKTINLHSQQSGRSANKIAFNPSGRIMATVGYPSSTIDIWDPWKGILNGTLEGHTTPVGSISFSADGRFLASLGLLHGARRVTNTPTFRSGMK